jgi:hypothetical protein
MAISKPVIKRLTNGIKFEYTEGNEKGTVILLQYSRLIASLWVPPLLQ